MVKDAPAHKPIISAYPPAAGPNFRFSNRAGGARICGSKFDPSDANIIRLEGSANSPVVNKVPTYAPFVAAGFLFGVADMLHEVPFDPLLPWIFMGEGV